MGLIPIHLRQSHLQVPTRKTSWKRAKSITPSAVLQATRESVLNKLWLQSCMVSRSSATNKCSNAFQVQKMDVFQRFFSGMGTIREIIANNNYSPLLTINYFHLRFLRWLVKLQLFTLWMYQTFPRVWRARTTSFPINGLIRWGSLMQAGRPLRGTYTSTGSSDQVAGAQTIVCSTKENIM